MTHPTALVTGANGYVGSALVDKLLTLGYTVRALDLHAGKPKAGVTFIAGDLGRDARFDDAVRGVDVVFHLGAVVPFNFGRRACNDDVTRVNVGGTQKLLESAQRANVPRFVFASSTGVVFGGESIENGDESLPAAATPNDHYSRTKAQAEHLVRAADRPGGMRTVSLRPNGIWGPGEKKHIPKVLRFARLGLDRMIFGAHALTDFTHRDNLVEAFICAERALRERPEVAGGQAYFITDGSPTHAITFYDPLLEGLGYRAKRIQIPGEWMLPLAGMLEAASKVLEPVYSFEPLLSKADVRKVITHNYYTTDRAVRDLGYAPVVSYEDGMKACVEHERLSR